MGKYLIQVFIRELRNDLTKSKNEGGLSKVWKRSTLLVSDTGLRYIMFINVKTFIPRYKYICDVKSVSKRKHYYIVLTHGKIDIQKTKQLI